MVGSVVWVVVASLYTDIAPVQMVVVAIVDDSITGADGGCVIVDDSITGADVCCCQPK